MPTIVDIYQDTGCEVTPYCLECILPQCKYDDPMWYQRWKRQRRNRQIIAALDEGMLTVEGIAQRFRLTPRTIFRIRQRDREDQAPG